MTDTTPGELFQSGQLTDAIAAATDAVKRSPTDTAARGLLAQMLCFAGDLDRADKQLETIGVQKSDAILGVALVRQLIRAERARQQFYSDGRLPEFLEEPPEYIQRHLQASIHLRERAFAEAADLLEQAEAKRPKVAGICDGQSFQELRDLDDLTSCFFEVLTSNGKYYWIPFERVELIEFHKPEKPLDLLWRRAHMIVRHGPDGEVFLPVVYHDGGDDTSDTLRLGRATEWSDLADNLVGGVGQRIFLFDETDRPILQLSHIEFHQSDVSDEA